jgi:hypothetical protein
MLTLALLCALVLPGAPDTPLWSRTKAFPNTRAYVAPANTLVSVFDADAVIGTTDANYVRENARYALWWGLGQRLALEAGLQVTAFQASGTLTLNQQTVNVRWAWAEWGRLAANPTLAVGVAFNSLAAPSASVQLSLSDTWAHGPWALDVSFARELRGTALTQTYGLTAAMAYAWDALDIGVEGYARVHAADAGGKFGPTDALFLAGPYARWMPVEKASLVFDVGAGAVLIDGLDTSIPAIQPKLMLAWSLS